MLFLIGYWFGSLIPYLDMKSNIELRNKLVILSASVCKFTTKKFVFLVEILPFCVQKVERSLCKKKMTTKEIGYLEEDLKHSWKICKIIEKIFGFSMVFTWT